MRMTRLAVVGLLAIGFAAVGAAPASAQQQVRSCGNYGYQEGHAGDEPVFTREPIVGAGVEDIRVRVIRCSRARRMVRAFWDGRFDCNESGLRCTYGSFRCRNRRLGDEYWLARCFGRPRERMLKFRFGA
jgi:hypothetical protein